MDEDSVKEPNEDGSTNDENQTEVQQEDQDGAPDGSEGEDDQEPDGQEVEIVLEGDVGSQPDQKHLGIRKRINKLNGKLNDAKDETANVSADLENERQKTKLLQMALDQKQEAKPSLPPNPLDFDDGAADAKYVEALEGYNREFIRAEMAKHVVAPEPIANPAVEKAQLRHYEAASKLKVPDYDEVEDKAISILGNDTAKQLIAESEHSAKLMYFLGKNPAKAQHIADLVETSPVKAILELGALGASLKAQTKAKRNPAPNPDDELEGALSPHKKQRGPKGATFV